MGASIMVDEASLSGREKAPLPSASAFSFDSRMATALLISAPRVGRRMSAEGYAPADDGAKAVWMIST
jgi:hypothetical protein